MDCQPASSDKGGAAPGNRAVADKVIAGVNSPQALLSIQELIDVNADLIKKAKANDKKGAYTSNTTHIQTIHRNLKTITEQARTLAGQSS
mmetsp:Transcript_49767/g.80324  ORF Transcript_49767/g.80324 Transcript_49767/m.80324 type:complete len:90 (-) Transcript_49767:180-449(-)